MASVTWKTKVSTKWVDQFTDIFEEVEKRLTVTAYTDNRASLFVKSETERSFNLSFRLLKHGNCATLQLIADAVNNEVKRVKTTGAIESNNRLSSGAAMTPKGASPGNNTRHKSPLKMMASPMNLANKALRGVESFYGSPKITDATSKLGLSRSPGKNKSIVPKATEQQRSSRCLGTSWSEDSKNNNKDSPGLSRRLFTSLITDSSNKHHTSTDGVLAVDPPPSLSTTPLKSSAGNVSPNAQSTSMGFANLGNTCYMNAVLQPLLATPCFQNDLMKPNHVQLVLREAILSGGRINSCNTPGSNSPSEDKENRNTDVTGRGDSKQNSPKKETHLYKVLVQLLATKMKRDKGLPPTGASGGSSSSSSSHSNLDSRTQFLISLKKAVASVQRQFEGHNQNDAHEFLSLCLDLLRDEVVRINRSLPSLTETSRNDVMLTSSNHFDPTDLQENSSHSSFNSKFLTNEIDCPVNSNFQMTVQHSILCTGCGFRQEHLEKMLILSVFLPEPKEDSPSTFNLSEAFRSFFKEEDLEYTCDTCGHKEAKLQHRLLQLPRVLIIHLKRYKMHEQLGSVCKNFRGVTIPKFLNVESVVSRDECLLPSVPNRIKQPELENVLRRLSCHNKLELSVPPAPSLEEATDVTSSTSDVTSSNSTSHESSVSRLERLNEYESGYNSASTAAGDSQTSSSSTVVSSLPRVVVSQDCSHEETTKTAMQRDQRNDEQSDCRESVTGKSSVDTEERTPCNMVDSSEDDDRNLASIRKELRTQAIQLDVKPIDQSNQALTPGRDMEMRSPEGKTSVRKTPERKKARDYIEELPPKLSKLSQSAMKILSPIRPPKTSENIRTALSEKAPRSRDRASTMFDDALKSDEEETEDLNSASDKNESNTTRKSRRLLFKRNNKDKQTTDLNSKSAEIAAANIKMGRKRKHRPNSETVAITGQRYLQRGEMSDPEEASDLAEALQLSMQNHIDEQEQRDLDLALLLSRESISENNLDVKCEPVEHSSEDNNRDNNVETEHDGLNEPPSIKVEPSCSISDELQENVFRGTCMDPEEFEPKCSFDDRRSRSPVLNINSFKCTDLDDSFETQDFRPRKGDASPTHARKLHEEVLSESPAKFEKGAGCKRREERLTKSENVESEDEVMMQVDCTYDSDDDIREDVFVEPIGYPRNDGCLVKLEEGVSEKTETEDERVPRAVSPPMTSHDLSLADLRVASTSSPGKHNQLGDIMGCLDLDFYIPPIAGQEKPGERLLSQEENPEEDPPMFLKMEVESAKDEPNNNNIFDTWSLTENDEDTVLNRRFEEDEDGEEVGEEKVTSDVFLEEAQIKVECLDWDENIDSHGKEPKSENLEGFTVSGAIDTEKDDNCFIDDCTDFNETKPLVEEAIEPDDQSPCSKSNPDDSKPCSSSTDEYREASPSSLPSAYSYQLTSIICHLGQSASVGHYVSDVYNPETGTWSCFDDETVNSRQEANVLTSRQKPGYIFFYMHRSLFPDLTSS